MDIFTWLNEPAYVNRHVSPLYFIIVTIIALLVLGYAFKTRNRRAIRMYLYAVLVWTSLELGLFFTGIRTYTFNPPYHIIFIIGLFEDQGWVCLAYLAAEKIMKIRALKSGSLLS